MFRLFKIRCVHKYAAANEPMLKFAPGSAERSSVEEMLKKYEEPREIPIVINGRRINTKDVVEQFAPFDHKRVVAKFSMATKEMIDDAIRTSLSVRKNWEQIPLEDRADIFLRAADLMATKYRYDLIATTMLGQGKTVLQAEVDSTAEMIDFFRFHVQYALQLNNYSPTSNSQRKNNFILRGLEGFWASITPFNFTAIAGNLAATASLMGNVTVWKPSNYAVLSNYLVYEILEEAGVPPGVINFVPSDPSLFLDSVTSNQHLAGVCFTGSSKIQKLIYKKMGENSERYASFPRLIGECGGKNFHLVHPTAHLDSVAAGSVLAAFEYSGQKCSACSRLYVPRSVWPDLRDKIVALMKEKLVDSPLNFKSFTGGVIHDQSFRNITGYIEYAKRSSDHEIIYGGQFDNSVGYFINPTFVESKDPKSKLMTEEIFGPVLTAYVFEDNDFDKMPELIDSTTPYALTGSIYSQDQEVIDSVSKQLRYSAGNFYLNCKCTASLVNMQPFGGGRLSGTNDKTGGPFYLTRFVSPISVSESLENEQTHTHPSMS